MERNTELSWTIQFYLPEGRIRVSYSSSKLLLVFIITLEGNMIYSNGSREPLILFQASTVRVNLAFDTLASLNSFQKGASENDFLKSTQTSDFGSL